MHKNDENVDNKMLEHQGINFGNALCENSASPRESRSDSSEGEDSITNQDQNKNPSPLLESYDDSSKGEVSVEEQKLFEDQYSRNLAEAKELEGVVNECSDRDAIQEGGKNNRLARSFTNSQIGRGGSASAGEMGNVD